MRGFSRTKSTEATPGGSEAYEAETRVATDSAAVTRWGRSGGSGDGSAAEGRDSRASGEEASAERNESARRASRAAEREAAKRGERREQTESSCNLLATELVA